jgi:phenol 2-monooxygenase (NADPH)
MGYMSRVFQTFGGFTSGIGIHYAPSSIVVLPKAENRNEERGGPSVVAKVVGKGGAGGGDVHRAAKQLVVGQRMPPSVIVRAADYKPMELQDLLKSDTRFKIIVFCGDAGETEQKLRLEALAEKVGGKDGFLRKYTQGEDVGKVFDIFSIGCVFLSFKPFAL